MFMFPTTDSVVKQSRELKSQVEQQIRSLEAKIASQAEEITRLQNSLSNVSPVILGVERLVS
ncbi:hypothetical protein B0H17DRAFT_1027940 [Mycena rosella]|uniref:Uncharacterized protein n=1 Tax=Mycena rosella TaxID=1033263 RepID=A0AAD7H2X8_MYCRO|nr:hypothetical protein B0H17DRAFT_1027940 [Mycena rosella]